MTVLPRRNWKQWLRKILGVNKLHYGLSKSTEFAINAKIYSSLYCGTTRFYIFTSSHFIITIFSWTAIVFLDSKYLETVSKLLED